ncbi:hypothetical protein O1611_g3350 [Lasiodiplodia mahajangana]|uniref:Uncharacterized protein n=1 Tax=Lasiodiplodia mahajangana TaxID=1108764 RepID=A0ACC2JSV7_9PEZI|nr:hypothetical protein O1611_g3350 [Lasiodiplodia mahajangana]
MPAAIPIEVDSNLETAHATGADYSNANGAETVNGIHKRANGVNGVNGLNGLNVLNGLNGRVETWPGSIHTRPSSRSSSSNGTSP